MAAGLSAPCLLRHAGEAAVVLRSLPGGPSSGSCHSLVASRGGGSVAQADEFVRRPLFPGLGWSKPSSLQPAHGVGCSTMETMALALACSVALSTSADTSAASSRESGWVGGAAVPHSSSAAPPILSGLAPHRLLCYGSHGASHAGMRFG